MKPVSGDIRDKEKEELMKKKEAALKEKQTQQESDSDVNELKELGMKIKKLDQMVKELTMEQEKLKQLENDESVNKEELPAKQKQLKTHLLEVMKKRDLLEKQSKELK
jgi:hypothetical protein